MAQLHDSSAPSNDQLIGFESSTRIARANWAAVGRESMLGLGIEPSILPSKHAHASDIQGGTNMAEWCTE
jgi:hypothetical protein